MDKKYINMLKKFVAKKKEHREKLKSINIVNNVAYASNGHILCKIELEGNFINGLYNIKDNKINPLDADDEFYEFERIIPNIEYGFNKTFLPMKQIKQNKHLFNDCDFLILEGDFLIYGTEKLKLENFNIKDTVKVNKFYLLNMLEGDLYYDSENIKNHPLVIKKDNITMLLMGML